MTSDLSLYCIQKKDSLRSIVEDISGQSSSRYELDSIRSLDDKRGSSVSERRSFPISHPNSRPESGSMPLDVDVASSSSQKERLHQSDTNTNENN